MRIALPLVAAMGLMLSACGETPAEAPPQAMPVQTITVSGRPLPEIIELPGRIEAVRVAEVRARVTGIIQRRLFEEGTTVRAGQPLFRIDPSELRAAQAQVEASLQRARATAANTAAVVDRYRPLVEQDAISRQEYDAAVAANRGARADVAQLQAQLRASSLQLGYTNVTAPISGRVGRAEVTEGAFVTQAEGTLLTRIEQMSPVWATIEQSAADVLRMRRMVDAGELRLNNPVRAELILPDGSTYGVTGTVDFLGQSVTATTGTVQLRAEFANPEGLLLPGEFVRVRLTVGEMTNGISVPQGAVSVTPEGGSVFVAVNGKAVARPVVLGEMINGQWLIESGLKPGDVVITNNLQKLRDGAPVQVQQPAAARAQGQAQRPSPAPAATQGR
ncbi:efflux RND transporter periplasmic adaptor subunit [Croceibacterium ferulae]|uniref:efflux RND transporter periplasmic adaptor subunit n=1 Tax=Croceibacterium ferulae TaxID=1854641 RepID=UPI000EB14178|nr:efflux RND transporter periplasmic adaptor subunit [Croceibacterium ferulae]